VAQHLLVKFQQPVLVESFLPGREFTVGIVGTGEEATVLGVSEIVPIENWVGDGYGYENKEYSEDKVQIIEADKENGKAAGTVALAAWRALRCCDGGRVDIRCDAQGRPHFIEVNPLAGLRPDYSDLCLIAQRRGLTHAELVGRIMGSFFKRHPELKKPRTRVAA
jgi:D-alanine-D-alanine ligase